MKGHLSPYRYSVLVVVLLIVDPGSGCGCGCYSDWRALDLYCNYLLFILLINYFFYNWYPHFFPIVSTTVIHFHIVNIQEKLCDENWDRSVSRGKRKNCHKNEYKIILRHIVMIRKLESTESENMSVIFFHFNSTRLDLNWRYEMKMRLKTFKGDISSKNS